MPHSVEGKTWVRNSGEPKPKTGGGSCVRFRIQIWVIEATARLVTGARTDFLRLFKVDDFYVIWKCVFHFLLMISSNVGSIFYRFRNTAIA